MKLVQMKCPNCGADLDVEDGIDSFFCKYCGTKIVLEGQSDAVVKAKSRIRTMDKIGEMQKEYHRQKAEKARREAEERKKMLPVILGVCAALFVFIFAMMYFVGIRPEQKETERLEAIYTEVQTDIANGDYTSALVKANTIRWNGDGIDKRRQWDKTREELIGIIEDLQEKN